MTQVEVDPNFSLEDIYGRWASNIPDDPRYSAFLDILLAAAPTDTSSYNRAYMKARRELKLVPRKVTFLHYFSNLNEMEKYQWTTHFGSCW